MGKGDAKKKEPAGKGKGKQAAGASDEGAKDKGASKGGKGDKLGTCNFVKGKLHFSLSCLAFLSPCV